MKSGYGNTTTGHLFSNYTYKVDPFENKEIRNLVILPLLKKSHLLENE